MSEPEDVTIYADGACKGNPGPGGYGVVVFHERRRSELSGGFKSTTNNRMEIMAAIVGLETLTGKCRVTLYTDSEYLVKAMAEGRARQWQAHGWKRNKGERALNPDLWAKLLELCKTHEVEFKWVKGHDASIENKRCDRLAAEAARQPNLVDKGYEESANITQPRLF